MKDLYNKLFKLYGPQGWWPLLNHKGTNPTKTGSITGYHPGQYHLPETRDQKFEVIIGAILTQNTSWMNVEKALINLQQINALTPEAIITLYEDKLKEAIRPAGYYNQKANYLKNIAAFFINLKNKTPTRKQLLEIKGIGPETADSILLYAFHQPEFVIDTYTKRILKQQNIEGSYDELKQLFHEQLPKDHILFKEFHALLVEHTKHQ